MKCSYTGRKLFILCYFLSGFLYHAWDHNLRKSILSHNGGDYEKSSMPISVLCCLYTQCLPRGRKICKSFFHFGFTSSCCYFFCLCLFVLQKQMQKKCSNLYLLCPSFLGAIFILQPRAAPFLAFLLWRRLKSELQCTELYKGRRVKLYIKTFFLVNI